MNAREELAHRLLDRRPAPHERCAAEAEAGILREVGAKTRGIRRVDRVEKRPQPLGLTRRPENLPASSVIGRRVGRGFTALGGQGVRDPLVAIDAGLTGLRRRLVPAGCHSPLILEFHSVEIVTAAAFP